MLYLPLHHNDCCDNVFRLCLRPSSFVKRQGDAEARLPKLGHTKLFISIQNLVTIYRTKLKDMHI